MGTTPVKLPTITPAALQDPTLTVLNRNFQILAQQIAQTQGATGPFTFQSEITAPEVAITSDPTHPDDAVRLSYLQSNYGAGAVRSAFVSGSTPNPVGGGGGGTGTGTSSGGTAGPITILGVTQAYATDSNGNIILNLGLLYAPPSPVTYFSGFWLFLDAPDSSNGGQLTTDGTVALDGNTASQPTFNPQLIAFVPYNGTAMTYTWTETPPAQPQTWRIYCVTGNSGSQPTPIQYGLAGASPSYQFTVNQQGSYGPQPHFAPDVQSLALTASGAWPANWTANPNIEVHASGDQYFEFQVEFTFPTTDPQFSSFGGFNVVLENLLTQGQTQIASVPGTMTTMYTSAPLPVRIGSTAYQVWFPAFDTKGNQNAIQQDVTPSVMFTITMMQGPPGTEYCTIASNVTWFTDQIQDSSGGTDTNIVVNFSPPTDPISGLPIANFGGAALIVLRANGSFYNYTQGRLGPLQWFIPNPPLIENNDVAFLVSIDINGNRNSIVGQWYSTVTYPAGCFVAYGGNVWESLQPANFNNPPGDLVFGMWWRQTYTGVSVLTPSFLFSMGSSTGTLDLSYANLDAFESQFAAVPGSSFTIANIDAGVIKTGEFQVGGVNAVPGLGIPSQMKVFDDLGDLIGFIGDDTVTPSNPDGTGYVGGWLKQFRVGGTAAVNAAFATDNSGNVYLNGSLGGGNVTITGGTLTLTTTGGSGFTTEINNGTDLNGNVGGMLQFAGTAPNQYGTTYAPTGIFAYTQVPIGGSGSEIDATFQLASTGSAPFLQLANPNAGAHPLWSATLSPSNGLSFNGLNVVIQRQTGPGNPSFSMISDAQTWCQNLLTILRTHGLVT